MACTWCDDSDGIREWADRLVADVPLCLDTEFLRERTYFPRLALVQVHDGDSIRLVDTTCVAPDALQSALADRPLVMHACSEDLEALAAFTGHFPTRVEDTQIAAALTGEDMQLSYQRLVERVTGVTLAKGATRSDWFKRPLTRTQLEYAEDDVAYLPEVVQRLTAELERLGRLAWWHEECARLAREVGRRSDTANAWQNIRGGRNFAGQELSVLARLAQWREETARERDLPRGFLVRDAALLDLSRKAPRSLARLHKLGLQPHVIRRDGEVILGCIEEGLDGEPPASLPGNLEPEQRKLVKKLRARVADIAGGLNLRPDVLMRRRWLEALVRNPDRLPAALTGWRRQLVTEPLLEGL